MPFNDGMGVVSLLDRRQALPRLSTGRPMMVNTGFRLLCGIHRQTMRREMGGRLDERIRIDLRSIFAVDERLNGLQAAVCQAGCQREKGIATVAHPGSLHPITGRGACGVLRAQDI